MLGRRFFVSFFCIPQTRCAFRRPFGNTDYTTSSERRKIILDNSKLLSSLSYFSVFFAPLLLPFIVWMVADNRDVKRHSKRALVSHLIPTVLLVAASLISFFQFFSIRQTSTEFLNSPSMVTAPNSIGFWGAAPVLFMMIYSFLFMVVLVWNVVQGVKVFR
ncbi:DUF4870 domain-containing protein [Sporosarcina sp. BI001-red]|nr:DUF4870 domain-containing protein [Sporosarcina sp. BI001-red]